MLFLSGRSRDCGDTSTPSRCVLRFRSFLKCWALTDLFLRPFLQLPVWARAPGFKLYSYAFGCNLDELEEPDLSKYASLGDFFYRTLKPGARPIADAPLVRLPSFLALAAFLD